MTAPISCACVPQGPVGRLWREGAVSVASGAVSAVTQACGVSQPRDLDPTDVKFVGPLRISTADPLALPPAPGPLTILRDELLEAAGEALMHIRARSASLLGSRTIALMERTANGASLAASKVAGAVRRFVPAAAAEAPPVASAAGAVALSARKPVVSWKWGGAGSSGDSDGSIRFTLAPVPVCVAPRGTVGLGDAISATGLAADALVYDSAALDAERTWGTGQ